MSMRSLHDDPYSAISTRRSVIGKYLCLCLLLYTLVTTAVLLWGVFGGFFRLLQMPPVLRYISPWSGHAWALLWLVLSYRGTSCAPALVIVTVGLLLTLLQLAGWILCRSGRHVWRTVIRGCVSFQLTSLVLLCLANIMAAGPNQEMLFSTAAAVVIPLNLLLGLRWWRTD